MQMGQRVLLFIMVLAMLSCQDKEEGGVDIVPVHDGYVRAVDISFLPMVESRGITFFNQNDRPQDALSIFRESGINTVRIRLWHGPEDVHSSLEEVKAFAERVKAEGMHVWLCVHYSDTWADPGEQKTPQAWTGLQAEALMDSVYAYTRHIMTEIEPHIIQIGNEINNGMLYPLGSRWDNPEQFKALVREGIGAARSVDSTCKIMIHYAGLEGSASFYELFEDVSYDQIGISYYPLWHGKDLDVLKNTMSALKNDYGKEVIVAETAYPFTLLWNDHTNNIVGEESQLLPDFPASLEGQKDFFKKIIDLNKEVGGSGVAWWGAAWIAFDGTESTQGSTWENQALFDFTNKITPAAKVFRD